MTRMVQVVTGPMEGTSFLIVEDQSLSMGRSSQNDITLIHDPWISSSHLTLKNESNRLRLMDLSSSNGSYISGEKVAPHGFITVDEYFVLGSTLCRVSTPGPILTQTPLSVKKEAFDPFRSIPLVNKALKEARVRRSPVLGVLHLFLAVLAEDDPHVNHFLTSMKLNPKALLLDMEKYRLFSGKNQWINDFLSYQYHSKQKLVCMFSPQAQNLVALYGEDRPYAPLAFLKQMLKERYTVLFPLLGITEETKAKALTRGTERVTLTPYDDGVEDLTLPGDFWADLERELLRNPLVILTGEKGSGKTAVLEQCFHSLPKVNISCFNEGQKRIFDPEMFLVFHEVNELVPYINTIIKALREDLTIVIDHFGTLLHLLHTHNIEDTPLTRVLNRRKHPTLLAVGSKHLKLVKNVLKTPAMLHMDQRVKDSNTEILDNFLRDFEKECKRTLSPRAERYLVKILIRYNFTVARTFLDFCGERLRKLNFFYKELETSNDQEELSEAFFRYMHDRWSGTFEGFPGSRSSSEIDSLEMDMNQELEESVVEDDYPELFETMLKEILGKNLRVPLIYSDGSHRLDEQSACVREDKKNELYRQWELLVPSFRSGFGHWLKAFLREIDPAELKLQVDNDPQALWQEYSARFELFENRFIRDNFLETVRKVYLRKRKDAQPGPGTY